MYTYRVILLAARTLTRCEDAQFPIIKVPASQSISRSEIADWIALKIARQLEEQRVNGTHKAKCNDSLTRPRIDS